MRHGTVWQIGRSAGKARLLLGAILQNLLHLLAGPRVGRMTSHDCPKTPKSYTERRSDLGYHQVR